MFFDEVDGFADCPVFAGPALVEQMDSTTVVHPGQVVIVDGWGNLLIAVGTPHRA